MTTNTYQYTECGLDNVYLVNGYEFVDTPRGRQVTIKDIDGLHKRIGSIVSEKENLSGKEVRFLRHEMLMSQSTLAKLLGVSEQAIRRWENGKSQVPKPAEALIRLLYEETTGHPQGDLKKALRRIADLEDVLDGMMTLRDTKRGWEQVEQAKAA